MSPKKIFKKSQHFEFFQKRGVKGVKKRKILKKYLQNQKGFQKLDTKHVLHVTKEDFQKSQNFKFFLKKGVKGVKK